MPTLNQLFGEHLEAIALKKDHVPITVEFTISVLEELKTKYGRTYPTIADILESKISDLRTALQDDLGDVRFGQ